MVRIWVLIVVYASMLIICREYSFHSLIYLMLPMLVAMCSIGAKKHNMVYSEYASVPDARKNPLYKRGYFKCATSNLFYKSQYKGLYICQMTMICIVGIADAIFLMSRTNQRLLNSELIYLLEILGWAAFLIAMVFRISYIVRYEQDYSYFENEEGIWQPFSYIFQHILRPFFERRGLKCVYNIPYEEILTHLNNPENTEGYLFSGKYDMGDGDEACIFTRKSGERLDIFEIAHIHRLEPEHFDRLNETFSLYWEEFVGKGRTVPDARIIFVIMADEYYKELEELLFDLMEEVYIRQKKGRNRLPCFILGKELKIVLNRNPYIKPQEYNEMLEDLLKLLKIRIRHYSGGRIKILDCNFYSDKESDEFYEKTESRRKRKYQRASTLTNKQEAGERRLR